MAWTRPTLTELVDRVEQDFLSRLELVTPILRRSMVYVMARVLAGAAHMLHGGLEYLSQQIFPDLSDEEYLLRQAALFGMGKTPAAYATGNVVLVGTNGSVVEADSALQRADGTEYETDAEATVATLTAWAGTTAYAVGDLRQNSGNVYLCITAGTSAGSGGPTGTDEDITDGTVHWRYIAAGTAAVSVAVTAVVAGADGNCDLGTVLTFESPAAGVNSEATISTGGLAAGADEETTDALRVRFLERLRSPPHGGNATDYVAWAKEVAGVTRAWCYPLEDGPGTVTVRFVRDDDASIIPDSGEVDDVQDHIDELAPVTAVVTVEAPTADELDFTIEIYPDTVDTRAAVEAELEDLLRRDASPGGTILLSQIEIAIGTAAGVSDFDLTVPSSDVVHATGHIAVMGTITWV